MISICRVIYKSKKIVEGYTLFKKGNDSEISTHYDVYVEEIRKGRNMQEIFWLDASQTSAVIKLNETVSYSPIILVIDILFYKNKPNKIKILDVITEQDNRNKALDILNQYQQ